MLRRLFVDNYALISQLEIDFRKGLSIITGETGAGKSILLGAMSLILGKRADTTVLNDNDKKCVVEGTFELTGYNLEDFFEDNNLDFEPESILRREISSNGKSRAFINDVPVNLEVLNDLGIKLIDIHSQHQNLNLSNSIFQMKIMDSYAQNQQLLDSYQAVFIHYQELQQKYRLLNENADKSKADLDYLQFQFNQLEEAKIKEGEQEELELELEKLSHAEEIKNGLATAYGLLQSEGESALQQLKECLAAISRIDKYYPAGQTLSKRAESVYIELKDIAHELDQMNNQVDLDPGRLDFVKERLDLLYALEKKHHVTTIAELLQLKVNLSGKIAEIDGYDFNLLELEKQVELARQELKILSEKLTSRRRQSIAPVENQVTEMLHELGMPNGSFKVSMETLNDFSISGSDRVQFLFTANKNTSLQEISKIASGGELSRLMLSIKSLLSDSIGLPTIIFDEIDTGVSGEIAEKVGNIISRMSERMQIINITHLPQVASKGDNHYLVYKSEEGESTITRIKRLTDEERHLEIAKMLSGEEVTSAALENARELLGK